MEYINLDIERKFLKGIFYNRELYIKTMSHGILPVKVFADKTHRLLFKLIRDDFNKQGVLPKVDILKSQVNRLSQKTKDADKFQEKAYSVIDRLFSSEELDQDSFKNFDLYMNECTILYEARCMQEYIMEVSSALDESDVEGANNLIRGFQLPTFDEDVEEGEITETFKRRESEVVEKYKNPDKYQLMPFGIPELDEKLDGGIGRELGIIYGNSNSGKSYMLQHSSVNNYRLGKNIILFTIEMRWQETMDRIDNILTHIGSDFWRNPSKNWTKDKHKAWRKKIQFAHKNYGNLQVVSFAKGATVSQLETKAYEIMNRWKVPIHGIYVDYLDDLTPIKKHKEEKSWTSFGELAWDLHTMVKGYKNFDHTVGVPVITASQMKKLSKEVSSSKDSRNLDERDAGSSPLPFRIAEMVLGIKTLVDNAYSTIEVMKARNSNKGFKVNLFHNYPIGKFHDEDLKDKILASLDSEVTDELQEMEIDNPEDVVT